MNKYLMILPLLSLSMTSYAWSAETCGEGDFIAFTSLVVSCGRGDAGACKEATNLGVQCGWSYTLPALKH